MDLIHGLDPDVKLEDLEKAITLRDKKAEKEDQEVCVI